MESQQTQNSFRSSYISSIVELFYTAEEMTENSRRKLSANKENYKGQLLDEKNQTEKQLCQRNLEVVCSQIEKIRDAEIELLTKKKESELRHPPKDILENLTNLKDIITEAELQLYADKCMNSTLVQRRIKSIALERDLSINTYPEFDEKIEAVREPAAAFISYIKYGNFGMEPAIYEKTTLPEYDNILEPVVKGGAE